MEAVVRRRSTDQLEPCEIAAIRRLLEDAFGSDPDERFGEDDWQHALGGVHFLLEIGSELVAHASVVERELHVGQRPLRTGYVEAVATAPAHQRRRYGTSVMEEVGSYLRQNFELGALGTGEHAFYERLGWETWRGPSYVRTAGGVQRTPDEDGYIMILRTPTTPPVDLTDSISCDWRLGDVW